MSDHFISVSTITPCFRGERYLGKFLESVAAQTIFEVGV